MHPNPFSLGQDDCVSGPLPCFQYSNRDQEAGARAARITEEAALLVLIFNMVFAKSVKYYFQTPLTAASNQSAAGPGKNSDCQ
jgi:hypothetical protein